MTYTVYSDKKYKKFLGRRIARQSISVPDIVEVPGGIVLDRGRAGFGVFSANGEFIDASCQTGGKNHQIIPPFNPSDDMQYIDKDVVYLGTVNNQFGHFLLERMNRAYALLNPIYRNMTVVFLNNKKFDKIPNFIYDMLGILGIARENVLIIDSDTKFKRVIVPRQTFNIALWAAPEFVLPFEEMAKNVPDVAGYEKVYMSRTALDSRRTYGEDAVQKIFENNGFKIVYPEKLPLVEQIAIMKNCRTVAGCAGTALHMALFMPRGGTVIQIKRNAKLKDNADTQNLINRVKELNGVFISASVEPVPTDHGTFAPQIIGVTKYMRQFFDENGYVYSDVDAHSSDVETNAYKIAMNEYRATHGSVRMNKIKNKIIRVVACMVPGRNWRGQTRRFLKRVLNVD